jgi:hypothetical protein
MRRYKLHIVTCLTVILTACGGGSSSCSNALGSLIGSSSSCSKPAPQQPPTANGGGTQYVVPGSTVTLDASKSTGQTLTYRWSLTSVPAGSSAKLQITNPMQPTFVADLAGAYVVTLIVNDGKMDSAPDIITITASTANLPPTANAGVNQNIATGTTAILDASASSDPNRDALTYSWQLVSRPSGSTAALAKSSDVKTTFVADKSGTYVAQLQVSDGKAQSELSYVTINAQASNSAPVAIVGPNQYVSIGSTVTLDGTASSDANRDALTYQWLIASSPQGSKAQLLGATTAKPTLVPDLAGSYVVSLRVNDGQIDSDVAFGSIYASAANVAPVASAGSNQNVLTGTTVTLDGSASSDANRDLLTYSWAFVSKPALSNAKLSDTSSAKPSFQADIGGSYVVSLIVSDGKLNSTTDYTTVTAANANLAPTAKPGNSQFVVTGAQVMLDGSTSSDPNRNPLTYNWTTVSKPTGSNATLANDTTPQPRFTADQSGLYVFSLIVNNGVLSSPVAYVSVNAAATIQAPVAMAGPNLNVTNFDTITLDGSASFDANNAPLSYQWTLVSRPATSTAAALLLPSTVNPKFKPDVSGTYVLSLVVSNGRVSSTPAVMTVTASSGNLPPTANAGTDLSVAMGASVTLDGTRSSDPNGDRLTYSWALAYKPTASTTTLLGTTGSKTVFVADVVGIYVFSLIVNDGQYSSEAAYITVTAK